MQDRMIATAAGRGHQRQYLHLQNQQDPRMLIIYISLMVCDYDMNLMKKKSV